MNVIQEVYLLLVALILGSFSSVLVTRVPVRESIGGRSKCPRCGALIQARDNIPLISFLILGGRCRTCRERISLLYPALEVATLLLAILISLPQPTTFLKLALLVFAGLGLALTVIDLRTKRLPNSIITWLTAALLILLLFDARGGVRDFVKALLFGIAFSAFLFALRIASRGGMGLGDVKFAFPIGLLTGYLSPLTFAIASGSAFVIGAVVGLALLISGRAGRKTAIPFGPFLYLGALIAIVLNSFA